MIENNLSTIKLLEPIARDIAGMTTEQARALKLPKQVHILHLRAVHRLYGDQGVEVLDLLKKSPSTAVRVRMRCALCATWMMSAPHSLVVCAYVRTCVCVHVSSMTRFLWYSHG